MTRPLPPFSIALALLALPGCACEVLVSDDRPYIGFFTVNQISPNLSSVSASFHKTTVPLSEVSDPDGKCGFHHFTQGSGSPLEALDVGELRVTGGLADVVVDFEGGYFVQNESSLFEAGDTLTLHVEGNADVDPMSATLTAPPVPAIAPPPATIDRSEDLTFTWTSPPGTGTLSISVGARAKGDSHPVVSYTTDSVACWADVSKGTLTIPASLLSKLPTDGGLPASVGSMIYNLEIRDRGESRVSFMVDVQAITPDGQAYQLEADLK